MEVVEQSQVKESNIEDSTLGTFKDVQTLKSAYDNLRSEFTRKSQLLAELRKNMDGDKVQTPPETLDNDEKSVSKEEMKSDCEAKQNCGEILETRVGTMHIDSKNAVKTENDVEKSTSSTSMDTQDKDQVSSNQKALPFWQRSNWDTQIKQFFEQFDMDANQKKEMARLLSEDKDLEYSESPLYIAYAKLMHRERLDIDKLIEDENFVESKILSNEKIKNRIINDYLGTLNQNRWSVPKVMANTSGYDIGNIQQRKPNNLGDAYHLVKKYFE